MRRLSGRELRFMYVCRALAVPLLHKRAGSNGFFVNVKSSTKHTRVDMIHDKLTKIACSEMLKFMN